MTFQHLGDGVYRVGGMMRSALTGRYTTPDPEPYECVDCGAKYATPSASQDCCGDWLLLGDD